MPTLKTARCRRCQKQVRGCRRRGNIVCATCREQRTKERRAQYDHHVPPAPRHTWTRKPIQLRTDFLVALPELRAEYARVSSWDPTIFVEAADPLRIPRSRRFR